MSISSISIEAVLLLCLDVGKESDSNAVDENVLMPNTVSALRDKTFFIRIRKRTFAEIT